MGRASMGPPRRRGGRSTTAPTRAVSRGRLQWGHLVVEVEGYEAPTPEAITALGFNGATSSSRWKGPTPRPFTRRRHRLQWGHLVVEVEGCLLVEVQPAVGKSSNGATSSSRWKADVTPRCAMPKAVWASMGPPRRRGERVSPGTSKTLSGCCFNGATSSSRWKDAVDAHRRLVDLFASMGPPRRRGGWATSSRCSRAPVMLQWGHLVVEVEGTRDSDTGCNPESELQWGHLVVEVEGRPAARQGRARRAASMGPPRRRGGRSSQRRW